MFAPSTPVPATRRHLTVLGIACLALVAPGAVGRLRAQDPTRTLAGYRGKNRVLVVFAASGRDPGFVAQNRLWEHEQAGFADRALVTLPVFAAARRSAPLAGKYGVIPGRFTVILVGKDGREAFRSEQPVSANDLYSRIDAMPMRRAEMREKAGAASSPASR